MLGRSARQWRFRLRPAMRNFMALRLLSLAVLSACQGAASAEDRAANVPKPTGDELETLGEFFAVLLLRAATSHPGMPCPKGW